MLEIIFYTLLIFISMYGLYFFITSLFAFLKDKKEVIDDSKLNKFAIIIAARNEEKVIGNLIDSLKKQNYNKNKYEIDVIVNNCTDNTRDVSLSHGANVIDCDVKVKSKGEVLRYTFNKLKNRKLDAYIIFDADNIIIVTQEYHLYRALYISDKLNVNAYGVNSDPRKYSGQSSREFREILARNKDFVNCIIKPEPKYLGELIPVSGNGDVTNDK